MKHCPQCNRVESDEALKFCRVDGATLIAVSASIDREAGTAQLGSQAAASEGHTSILPHHTLAQINRQTGHTNALPPPPAIATQQLAVVGRRKLTIVLVVIVILTAIAIGGYFGISKFTAARKDRAIESVAVLRKRSATN